MLRGATINGAAASPRQVLRHVRRHAHVPALAHKLRGIESLVAAHGHTLRFREHACSITIAASRSAVPVASHTRLDTINPLRFSTSRFPL